MYCVDVLNVFFFFIFYFAQTCTLGCWICTPAMGQHEELYMMETATEITRTYKC